MRIILTIIAILLASLLAAAGVAYSGLYNVAADEPHWSATTRLLETVRVRSIARRAAAVQPPNLDDPQLVLKGAGQYAAMCSTCHHAPGMKENQLAKGLYPAPPALHERQVDPREAFIVIKHGLKMTGMPAWGGDHGDEAVWSLVAFVRKLPGMTPQQYRDFVRKAPADDEAAAHAETPGPSQAAMPPHAEQSPSGEPSRATGEGHSRGHPASAAR